MLIMPPALVPAFAVIGPGLVKFLGTVIMGIALAIGFGMGNDLKEAVKTKWSKLREAIHNSKLAKKSEKVKDSIQTEVEKSKAMVGEVVSNVQAKSDDFIKRAKEHMAEGRKAEESAPAPA